MTVPSLTIRPELLHDVVSTIVRAAGSDAREAGLVADHLVAANLAGHDSHGVGMVPSYLDSLAVGELRPGVGATVVRDAGAVLTIDGGRGYGQVVAHEAMELAIGRVRELGVCVTAVRGAHHVGRIGHWAEQCARAGLVSIHLVSVVGEAYVAPFGGSDARFGTNPVCVCVPRPGQDPVLLDMATSTVALGKTRVAHNSGLGLEPGRVLDADGRPTTDPGVMWTEPRGALTAFGLHKGSGLAVMAELLAGAVSGGLTTHAASTTHEAAIVDNMLSIVMSPDAFEGSTMAEQTDLFLESVAASRPETDGRPVLLPGQPEAAAREARRDGVPVDVTTWAQIVDGARSVGVPAEVIAGWPAA
ncbi:malate/lactate/ureidoglycolate dehydrogenase [Arsenicicoccus sp. oral taxon 190]|uniref:malate/lactate/ureidoglycolate dehydrogenase n=1 Tax=Arsenicicoccus sp. oral taxon 190 TaxID=1658671 RepID=UPI00067A4014|nr:malate/lactate/ureidoglycolate dehydrogenase [Arsenicicoccus sp. oral taxon 190]AKT51647.1 dehydrogenase [Arsenicicoccus sp. oral taxon 190]